MTSFVLAAFLLIAVALTPGARGAEPPATPSSVAFVGVNVVPMTGERLIVGATVLITDGVVAAIGPEQRIGLPAGALVINARGKYLLPGLAEMHAHVPGANAAATYRDDVLLLYVAHGVTLARGMLGEPMHLKLRDDLAAHRVLGPRLFTSGPSLNGKSAPEPAQAVRMVREQKAAGYDFLKLHPGLSRETFLAMAGAARQADIDFAGHVSTSVGLRLSLENGQKTVDHLDGYMQLTVSDAARNQPGADDMFGLALGGAFDEQRLPAIVAMTRAAGTWNVPTQTLLENFVSPQSAEQLDARAEMRFVPDRLRERYRRQKAEMSAGVKPEEAQRFLNARLALIKALHDAGAGMLLGSDAPQVFNVPGASAHRELQSMVEAGLTAYEALAMGTSAPAKFFAAEGRFGAVIVGAEADLVLLNANPLADIANTQQIEGVMVRGRWLDREWLDRALEGVAMRARGAL